MEPTSTDDAEPRQRVKVRLVLGIILACVLAYVATAVLFGYWIASTMAD